MATLSICIPTYNRSRLLSELLDSIIAQNNQYLEVIVSDDASPDDTESVARSYFTKIAKYRYIRQPMNIGLDRNFLAAVEAATSDYIWLMGDDDVLESGGAQRVLDALERWPGVSGLTLGVVDYDVAMAHPVGIRRTPPTQLLKGVNSVFSEIPELLGFMSALVADRARWKELAASPDSKDFENYYIQVYLIGKMIGKCGTWGIVQESCVRFRTGNDQFNAKFGWFKRLKIDVEAYEQIAAALFENDSRAYAKMQRRIFNTHVMSRITNAKIAVESTPEIIHALSYLCHYYGKLPRFWTRAVPTLVAPKCLIRQARLGYKRFAKRSGAARARALISEDVAK